jgi:uncharacterized protein (DUF4415 family)
MSEERIVSYSIEEIRQMKDLTDWDRVRAETEDPPYDEDDFEVDWSKAVAHPGFGKKPLSLRLDAEILAFFKAQGKGYQTRINAVLKAYKEAYEKAQTEGGK